MYTQQNLKKVLESFGQNTAIEEDGHSVAYSELLQRSEKVTARLLSEFNPQSRVGICITSITDTVVCILGIIQARCVFVPLDASLPESRFSHIISESALDLVIISETNHATVKQGEIHTLVMTDLMQRGEVTNTPLPEYQEEDDLYIYFTSGTTGVPKGIIGKNKSLWHFIDWEINTFAVGPRYRFSQLISPFFDAFLRDIFVPLMSGGTICVPPKDEDFFSPEKLLPWVDKEQIDLIHCVPSVFRIINQGTASSHHLQSLKYVLLSGEKIRPSELADWYRIFEDRIQLVNLYGTTEATMISSCYRIRPEDASQEKVSIGQPIDNTELLVLDEHQKPCPPNSTGDLYIASQYLSGGYLNDPELTSSRFITLDESVSDQKVAFRTGDRAKVLPDRTIDLLGREDRMIKIRGIRVELDEIESLLAQCPLVDQAATAYHQEKGSVVAFITEKDSNDPCEPDQVMEHLKEHLPTHILPSKVSSVKRFPLLSNGKVNYRKLMEDSDPGDITLPTNPIEEALLEIWSDTLNLPKHTVCTTKSFFELGGHSINVIILVNRIFREFNVQLSVREVFNYPSIKSQAEVVVTVNEMKEEVCSDFTEVFI